jgi:RimJ/RimL family protein N-acetyltransferase
MNMESLSMFKAGLVTTVLQGYYGAVIKPIAYQSNKAHTFIIRPMAAGDVRSLLTFANALIAEDTFIMLSGKKLTMKEETGYVTEGLRLMKKNEKIRLVATLDGIIVGSAEIRRGQRRKHHIGEIGISILKPYRGQGLGRELMRRLIREGKRMGLRMLMLHSFENNTAALALYKKFGFTRSGILPGALNYRGGYVGEVTLYKNLS